MNPESLNLTWIAARMIFSLTLVICIAILLLRWILPRFSILTSRNKGMIRIIESQRLQSRKELILVELESMRFLIGLTDQSFTVIHCFRPQAHGRPDIPETES